MVSRNETPTSLNNFMELKQKEILAIAMKNTEEVVKKEIALSEFELLLSANISKKEELLLNKKARKLREESWVELENKYKDPEKIQEFLNTI